jgi:hypothetical protein
VLLFVSGVVLHVSSAVCLALASHSGTHLLFPYCPVTRLHKVFAASRDPFWTCSHLYLIHSLRMTASAFFLRGVANVIFTLHLVCTLRLRSSPPPAATNFPSHLAFCFFFSFHKKHKKHHIEHNFVLHLFDRIIFVAWSSDSLITTFTSCSGICGLLLLEEKRLTLLQDTLRRTCDLFFHHVAVGATIP